MPASLRDRTRCRLSALSLSRRCVINGPPGFHTRHDGHLSTDAESLQCNQYRSTINKPDANAGQAESAALLEARAIARTADRGRCIAGGRAGAIDPLAKPPRGRQHLDGAPGVPVA